MMVDTVIYAGETTMLELRLRTLAPIIDKFVVVVSSLTHQGEPSPESFWDLPPYASQVDLTVYTCDPVRDALRTDVQTFRAEDERGGVGTKWYQKIERQHRASISDAVARLHLNSNDLVLVGDVDEIPSVRAIGDRLRLLDQMGASCKWLVLEQRGHSTALDLLHPHQPWLGTTVSRACDLAPQAMRDARKELWEGGCTVKMGGHHFSWFGTDADRQMKLDTFSHAELRGRFDPAEGRRTLRHANGESLRKLTLTELEHLDWPRPIRNAEFDIPKHWWADV